MHQTGIKLGISQQVTLESSLFCADCECLFSENEAVFPKHECPYI